MTLARCQINPIDVNFHLQRSLESFDKNSAAKNLIQKDREWKVPCLMPIRAKETMLCTAVFLDLTDKESVKDCLTTA